MAQNQKRNPHEDFTLKETKPQIGGGRVSGLTTTYDLVEQMHYLYVKIVKAKDLQGKDVSDSADPYVEVKVGNYKGMTHHFENKLNPEWNLIFAFSKDRIQASNMEVVVKDKDAGEDDFMGRVLFELNEVPKRVPPDSPLAPQWYRLEDRKGETTVKGELMLAVWMGTQADEAFPDAWHSDAAVVNGEGVANIRSKVYLSPKLWYLRVNVIEAQDLVLNSDKNRKPDVYVKAMLGSVILRSKFSPSKNANPMWNEDLMFVAAEPFEEPLMLYVQDKLGQNKDEILGKCTISLQKVDKRLDAKPVGSWWCNLEKHVVENKDNKEKDDDGKTKDSKFASRLHLRICLEGGYHVLDESTNYSSDLKPTAKQLWKPSIGVLELGILTASGLLPKKTRDDRATTDAYCVAKFGQKWVRTRTIIDSLTPKWNEQYTWEVFDPCTVITIGVFDNCHLQGAAKAAGAKDSIIGKVRIRLSTLETGRVYTYSYPLLVLQSQGVKKMGEIQLAVRFSSTSLFNTIPTYFEPLLPKLHYTRPLTVYQLDSLRHQATQIVSLRMSRAEPPLRKEAVEYMLDVGSHLWSLRRSKANFYRIVGVLSGLTAFCKWFNEVCHWKNPITTCIVHILYLIMVLYPQLILPTVFLYWFLIGVWNFRGRPRHPPHMDTKLSCADVVLKDELEEEFDTFPSTRPLDVVRNRYDRLRSIAGRLQAVVGDLATQGERLQSLLSWRDPRASALFVMFCLIAALLLFVIPIKFVILLSGFYVLRHPKFLRNGLPSVPLNFFRRLPTRADSLL